MINEVTFLQQLKNVTDYMVRYKWKYATSGHPGTWSTSVTKKVGNCSHMVSLSLQRAGFLQGGQKFYAGDYGVIHYIGANTKATLFKYFELITVKKSWKEWKSKAKAGDILCWNFHTSVYAGSNSKGCVFYDAGRQSTTTKAVGGLFTNCHVNMNMDTHKLYYVLRLKDSYRTLDLYQGTFPNLPARGYLMAGDTGSNVELLQIFLNWAVNAGLTVDGDFGSKTKAAVISFQGKVKLKQDGLFGSASLELAKKFHK